MKLTVKAFFSNIFVFLFVIVSLSEPESFSFIGVSDSILSLWNLCKYLTYLIVLFMFVIAFLEKRKVLIWDVVVLFGIKIIITFFMELEAVNGFIYADIDNDIRALIAVIFVSYMFMFSYKKSIKRIFWFLSILVFLNAITIVMYPAGMYNNGPWENYFLGYDNGHVLILLPAIVFAILYYKQRKNVFSLITISVAVFSIVKCFSGTTVMGFLIFIILYVAIRFPIIGKYLFNKKMTIALVVGLFMGIVVFRLQENLAAFFFEWLNKDVTLTGRVYLWDVAIQSIIKHPICGIGGNTEVAVKMFSLPIFGGKLAYAHNEVLDYLVRYGVIGFMSYIVVIVTTFRHFKTKNNQLYLCAITAFWVMMMFESYSNYRFYYMYFLLLIIPRYMEDKVYYENRN